MKYSAVVKYVEFLTIDFRLENYDSFTCKDDTGGYPASGCKNYTNEMSE